MSTKQIVLTFILSSIFGILSNIIANWLQPTLDKWKRRTVVVFMICGTSIVLLTIYSDNKNSFTYQNTTSSVATSMPTEIITTAIESTKETVSPYAVVVFDYINLRSGPSTDFDIISQYPKDTKVQIIGKNDSNDWLYVKTTDLVEGWMSITGLDVYYSSSDLGTIQSPPTPTRMPTAVSTTGGSSSPRPISNSKQFVGEWSGNTSQGHPITFSVIADNVGVGPSGHVVFDVGNPPPACLELRDQLTFPVNGFIINESFSDSHLDSTWSYSITGNFSSATTASGTFEASVGIQGSDCFFRVTGIWDASKN